MLASRNYRLILSHLLFWLGYLGLITASYSTFVEMEHAISRALHTVSFQAAFAYLNISFLIPLFLKQKAYLQYLLTVILLIALLLIIRFWIEDLLFDPPSYNRPGRPPRGGPLRKYSGATFGMLTAWGFSTAYIFIKDWFQNQQTKAELTHQQLTSELKFLKNQINPHFLFNTLNNLYTLCYMKDERAAPVVIKLSEMMRYMLKESSVPRVPLQKEVDFLHSFIELQQLKTDEARAITFEVSGATAQHTIPPLLLLNFFENAFEHGDWEKNPNGWVKAHLNVSDRGQLHFTIANSVKSRAVPITLTKGIGLQNVVRRLELLYRGQHMLTFRPEADRFEVELALGGRIRD